MSDSVLKLRLQQGCVTAADDAAYVEVWIGEQCVAKVRASVRSGQGADGSFYPVVKVEEVVHD